MQIITNTRLKREKWKCCVGITPKSDKSLHNVFQDDILKAFDAADLRI